MPQVNRMWWFHFGWPDLTYIVYLIEHKLQNKEGTLLYCCFTLDYFLHVLESPVGRTIYSSVGAREALSPMSKYLPRIHSSSLEVGHHVLIAEWSSKPFGIHEGLEEQVQTNLTQPNLLLSEVNYNLWYFIYNFVLLYNLHVWQLCSELHVKFGG